VTSPARPNARVRLSHSSSATRSSSRASGVLKGRLVAVTGGEVEEDPVAGLEVPAVQLDVLADDARHREDGRLEAQQLLDGRRD
jgi:hypothetical protein